MGNDLLDTAAIPEKQVLPVPTRVRYLVVALTTATAVLLYLDRICLSYTERNISEDLQLSNQETGWLLGAFFWAYALGQVPSGWLSDRFGARSILTGYIVAWSVFTSLMGAANSFLLLLLFRFGCGLAQAGAYPTCAAIISRWVPFSARALASGIVATGGRAGGFIAQALTAYLMVSGLGWRSVMVVYGAAGVLTAVVFWLVIRERPEVHPACNAAEVALIEEGRPTPTAATHVHPPLPLREMLQDRSLWLSSLSQFLSNVAWVFLISWLPRYLEEVHHVPALELGWMSGLPILMGMAGMLSGGWVTDRLTRSLGLRWGRALPMGLTRLFAAAAFGACLLCESAWGVIVALCALTIATDLGVPAIWAYMQDVGGRHVGAVLGWGNMWGNLGAALSPVVMISIKEYRGWNAVFLCCAAMYLIAGLAGLGVDATIPIVPAEGHGEAES